MGAEVINIHGNKLQAPGWPDCFVCSKIWTGFIEFKGPETRLEAHQARIIKALGASCSVNIWIVRFLRQEGDMWEFSVANTYCKPQLQCVLFGTEGQVAASLLHELKGLE
jgi:hypothetical protein